jgi:hypothetical protein
MGGLDIIKTAASTASQAGVGGTRGRSHSRRSKQQGTEAMHSAFWALALSAFGPTGTAQPVRQDPVPQETGEEKTAEAKTPEQEFAVLLEDAGRSVSKLWEAYDFANEQKWPEKAKEVLHKIVEINPYEQRAYELLGWIQVDMMWIPPEELPNVEKGLYKCGGQWLPLAEANQYHASPGQEWHLRMQDPRMQKIYRFEIFSTADRQVAEAALKCAEWTFPMLVDACGVAPEETSSLIVLRNLDQYKAFAAGTPSPEQTGYSSITGAFVCESFYDRRRTRFLRAGVTYWDPSTTSLNVWGKMNTRAAAALGFLEAVDPSPKSEVKSLRASGQGQGAEFWAEKKLETWFRYGVAFYAAGLFFDEDAQANGGDPYEVRNWLIGQMIAPGGLNPLDTIFAFRLEPQPEAAAVASEKKVWEAGLIVAFILEGKCPPVVEAHRGLKAALRNGEGHVAAFEGLKTQVKNHEAELREFAGLPPPPPAEPPPAAPAPEKTAEQGTPKD